MWYAVKDKKLWNTWRELLSSWRRCFKFCSDGNYYCWNVWNCIWRKRYNKELMQLFGDLDILIFVRISQMNWICHIYGMDSKRKVSQLFNNNTHRSWLRRWPKNRWWNCIQTAINKFKITNWKERSKNRADWEKSIKETKLHIGLSAIKEGGGGSLRVCKVQVKFQLQHLYQSHVTVSRIFSADWEGIHSDIEVCWTESYGEVE